MNPSIIGAFQDFRTQKDFKATKHSNRHGVTMRQQQFYFTCKLAALSTLPLIPIPTEMTEPKLLKGTDQMVQGEMGEQEMGDKELLPVCIPSLFNL